jgi:hypothetical protein
MLHESAVLSSHLKGYSAAVDTYATASDTFFEGLQDFMASTGDDDLWTSAVDYGLMITLKAGSRCSHRNHHVHRHS